MISVQYKYICIRASGSSSTGQNCKSIRCERNSNKSRSKVHSSTNFYCCVTMYLMYYIMMSYLLCLEVVCWMEPDAWWTDDHSEHDLNSDTLGHIFPGEVTLARSGASRHEMAEIITRCFLWTRYFNFNITVN